MSGYGVNYVYESTSSVAGGLDEMMLPFGGVRGVRQGEAVRIWRAG